MKVEIEVDVPDGYEVFCQSRRNEVLPVLPVQAGVDKQLLCGLFLCRVEPKRESRWANLYQHRSGMLYRSRDECTDVLSGERVSLIRIDYEDGKPVAVTLEPEGEEA